MRFPTVHDFIDFRYSRPAHVALLLVLLVVWLAQVVIAAVAGFKYYVAVYFAFGIVVPVLAVVLVYVRVLPFVEKFEWFAGDTVGVELVGYAIHMGLNAVALSPLINELSCSATKRYAVLLIACTVLEYLLEALLVYKLVAALVHLWRGSQEQTEKTLAELKGKGRREGAGPGVGAGESFELAVTPM